MKDKWLEVSPLILLLCWMLHVASKKITIQEDQFIPLSLSEDSVDDMYSTCDDKMARRVEIQYFKNETKRGAFKESWKHAEKCAKRSFQQKAKEDEALTKDHMQAICVYTSGYNGFYEEFNKAVRTQRSNYGSSFQYHSLHFWLTRAVQILSNNQDCHETYRRTKTVFTGKVKREIRFGTFTSTSTLSDLSSFGDETCFKIKTCSGAYLKKYPELQDKEQEVLVPPYEKFRIAKKCESKECKKLENLPDCKTVYVLESAGVLSNLDCTVVKSVLM